MNRIALKIMNKEQLVDISAWQESKIAEIRGYAGLTREQISILDKDELIRCIIECDKKFKLNTEIKEEGMDKFELNGIEYTQNDAGDYFYKKEEGGKKIRIKYEEFERAFDEYWAVQGVTDPVDEEQEKEVKAKKKRKSRDIAYEGFGLTLTAKQVDFIKHLPDNSFYENGLESCLWCDCLAEDIGGQFFRKPMTVGAMITTLREKNIVSVDRDDSRQGKPKYMALTNLGKAVAAELGLS